MSVETAVAQVREGQYRAVQRHLGKSAQDRESQHNAAQGCVPKHSGPRVSIGEQQSERQPDGCAHHGLVPFVTQEKTAAHETNAAEISRVARQTKVPREEEKEKARYRVMAEYE